MSGLHDACYAARRVERKCGLVTSNGVWRNKCKFFKNTPEISKLSNELKSRDVDKVKRKVLRKKLRRVLAFNTNLITVNVLIKV